MNQFMGMIYELSNNPAVKGAPGFEGSAFDVPAEGATVDVWMRY